MDSLNEAFARIGLSLPEPKSKKVLKSIDIEKESGSIEVDAVTGGIIRLFF